MTTADLTSRLEENFGPYIASDPSLLTESSSICTHYNVSPQDLYFKWEAFALNNALPKSEPFSIEHARELRKLIATSFNQQLTSSSSTKADLNGTPLKPSAALNRGKMPGDFTAMLGFKSTPHKHNAASAGTPQSNAFQTPSRPSSYSPFNNTITPGQTPATASAYRPTHGIKVEDTDISMADVNNNDTPSRPSAVHNVSAFSVIETLNANIPISGSGSQMCPPVSASAKKPNSRVSLAMATNPKAWDYRYMFEKKGERSQVLDDRIDEFANIFRSTYATLLAGDANADDESEEFGDPSLPSQDPIWVVGRICPGLPAPQSSAGQSLRAKHSKDVSTSDDPVLPGLPKLNETGVVLESSRVMGSGNRTPLVFAKGCVVRYTPLDVGTAGAATTLSLFPGQMVMCKGINAGTDKFSVSEICFPPPLPQAVHTAYEALEQSYSRSKLNGQPINVLAAAGPFTHQDDLKYEPWHALMDQLEAGGVPVRDGAVERRGVPDTLILSGPFVSSTHPLLPFAGQLPCDIFAHHFSARLATLIAKYPGIMVVLIPSTLDILNIHAAYPQPGFNAKDDSLRLPKQRLRCLPNPSVFYVNELVIGASTADSLGDLKSEEMVTRIDAHAQNPTPLNKDAVAANNKETNTRWSRSILSQRSFYPVYPPPSTSSTASASSCAALAYDTSHSHLLDFPAVSPDLLLLPSSNLVKPFIRVVNATTVIQPGSLAPSSSTSPGSFVCLDILPIPKSQLETVVAAAQEKDDESASDSIPSNFWERARIDIVSI